MEKRRSVINCVEEIQLAIVKAKCVVRDDPEVAELFLEGAVDMANRTLGALETIEEAQRVRSETIQHEMKARIWQLIALAFAMVALAIQTGTVLRALW